MPFITDLWYSHRARAGDRKAFDALFHRYSPRVYNLLRRLGAAPAEAEDLSQETFVTAFGSLPSWRESGALSTWLCGIAVNKYRAAHRRASSRVDLADDDSVCENVPAPPGDDPLAHLTRDETGRQLQAAIAALPDGCREAFVLVYTEEFAYRDVARLLDIPVGTVQSRLNRAKRLLHAHLSEYMGAATSPMPAKGTNFHVL
ncbi:MAG: sigma-70 family RNA polymerase sigma factor [Akkermansiaceae bacterium]|nr:sigma-70 family RNA polymerase sigma factor [Armatimonadota bacterium]